MSDPRKPSWSRIEVPSALLTAAPDLRAYQAPAFRGGYLSVFVGPEPGIGWHLSISHNIGQGKPGRYPTWDEIKDARYRFCPDEVTMAMLLPPRAEFVNVHDSTFHLYQIGADQ